MPVFAKLMRRSSTRPDEQPPMPESNGHTLHRKTSTQSLLDTSFHMAKPRSQSSSRRKAQQMLDLPPALPGKEARPFELFADVRAPMVGQSHTRQTTSIERSATFPPQRRPNTAGGERGRRRAPNQDKANRVLGREPDPAIRAPRRTIQTEQYEESYGPWPALAPWSPDSIRPRTAGLSPRERQAHPATLASQQRPAEPVELPAPVTVSLVSEKQVVGGHMIHKSQYLADIKRNDSVAELPADQETLEKEPVFVELQGSEVDPSASAPIELPGDSPILVEADAGPMPAIELPGSYGFVEDVKMRYFEQTVHPASVHPALVSEPLPMYTQPTPAVF